MSDAPKDIYTNTKFSPPLEGLDGLRAGEWRSQQTPYLVDRYTHNPNGTLRETIECSRCDAGYIRDKILGNRECSKCYGTGRQVKP